MDDCEKVFRNAWFGRFARKQRITDQALLDAVDRAERGLIDADLGSGVIKQCVARQGQGKSAGFRTIILYRKAERAFFVYGFVKNDLADIGDDEEAMFRKAAAHVLGSSNAQLAELIATGRFSEVMQHGEEVSE